MDRLPRTAKNCGSFTTPGSSRVALAELYAKAFLARIFSPTRYIHPCIREKLPELTVCPHPPRAPVVNSMFRKWRVSLDRRECRNDARNPRAHQKKSSVPTRMHVDFYSPHTVITQKWQEHLGSQRTPTSGMLLHDMMNNFSLFDFSSPANLPFATRSFLSFKADTLNCFSPFRQRATFRLSSDLLRSISRLPVCHANSITTLRRDYP